MPYDAAHIACMDLRDLESETIGKPYLIALADSSVAKTIFVGAVPIAVIGYVHMWKGVINVFVIPSKHVRKHARVFLQTVVLELDGLWKDPQLNLHRMQTKSIANPETDRWMSWLGFQCEGTMLGFSQNKEDYRSWARVRLNGTD